MTSPAAPRESIRQERIKAERDAAGIELRRLHEENERLCAELARVQNREEIAKAMIEGDQKAIDRQAAQIERLTQELEPLRIRQRRADIQELRVLIDGYQGTCFPLNRTSLHGLFDEIERLAQEIAALKALLAESDPCIHEQIRTAHEDFAAGRTITLEELDARLDAAPAEAQGFDPDRHPLGPGCRMGGPCESAGVHGDPGFA